MLEVYFNVYALYYYLKEERDSNIGDTQVHHAEVLNKVAPVMEDCMHFCDTVLYNFASCVCW